MTQQEIIGTGVSSLDSHLDNLRVGDNVIWYDEAGSLAWTFCRAFMRACRAADRPLVYVTFDRSPKNLLNKLGLLTDYPGLTVLDCFTWGKGAGNEVFLRFYKQRPHDALPRVAPMRNPMDPEAFSERLYSLHAELDGVVGFVFESLTGMQDQWGGEDALFNFYGQACPRLYELNTVAYWTMDKNAHSSNLMARINHTAQVVVDLSIKRGTSSLTVVKAENRDKVRLDKPRVYWSQDQEVVFEQGRKSNGRLPVGARVKELRTKKGLSQAELARLIGVTPSNISQVEGGITYPSLPALAKIAEVMEVEVSWFFLSGREEEKQLVFDLEEAVEIALKDLPPADVTARLLLPMDQKAACEPYLLEIPPGRSLPLHFFLHRGEELGHLIEGELVCRVGERDHRLLPGSTIHFSRETPTSWSNTGSRTARLLWVKLI